MYTDVYEFKSRTNKSIRDIPEKFLKERTEGITKLKNLLSYLTEQGERDSVREVIATMNYSVSQAEKELKRRKGGVKNVKRK